MAVDVFNLGVNATDNASFISDSDLQGMFQRFLQGTYGHYRFTVKTGTYAATTTSAWLQLDDTGDILRDSQGRSLGRFDVEYQDTTTPGSEVYTLWQQVQAVDPGDGSLAINVTTSAGIGSSLTMNALTESKFRIRLNNGTTVTNAPSETVSLRTAALKWTVSTADANAYYVTKTDDSDPGFQRPTSVLENGVAMTQGTLGSLNASEWNYGNNESPALTFETVYIRTEDPAADPDTKALNYYTAQIPTRQLPNWVDPTTSPYNATGDGTADDNVELTAADTAAGANGNLYIEAGKTYKISSEAAGPTFVSKLVFDKGGKLLIDGVTLTLSQIPNAPPDATIFNFANSGSVNITGKGTVYANWFNLLNDNSTTAVEADQDEFVDNVERTGHGHFLSGTYLIDKEFDFQARNNFMITGSGADNTIIKNEDAAPVAFAQGCMRFQNCTNFSVKDLTADGNRANRTPVQVSSHNIFLVGLTTDFLFENVRSVNAVVDGWATSAVDQLDFGTYPRRGMWVGCIADNCWRQGISFVNGFDFIVSTSMFNNTNGQSPQAGIDIEPNDAGLDPGVRNVIIDSCTFLGNTGNGVQVTEDPAHVIISNNYFENNLRGGIEVLTSHFVQIRGNQFYNQTASATNGVLDIGPLADHVIIDSNEFETMEAAVPIIYVQSNSTDVQITNNIMEGVNTVSGTGSGIITFADQTIISGNRMDNLGARGIDIAAGADDCIVKDNIVRSAVRQGINDGADRTKIKDNILIDVDTTATPAEGVLRVQGSNAQIVGNTIRKTTPDLAAIAIQSTTAPDAMYDNLIQGHSLTPLSIGGAVTDLYQSVNYGDWTNQGFGKGPDVASAADITLPEPFSFFRVTGTTAIGTITASTNGRRVTLFMVSGLRVDHLQGGAGDNIHITSLGGNRVVGAGGTITLEYDADNSLWYEVSVSDMDTTSVSPGAGATVGPTAPVRRMTPGSDITLDTTTAISDGVYTGQSLQLINDSLFTVTIPHDANTYFLEGVDITLGPQEAGHFWYDGTIWRDQQDPTNLGAVGSFTMANANSDHVPAAGVGPSVAITLGATDLTAAALQAGASALYVSDKIAIEVLTFGNLTGEVVKISESAGTVTDLTEGAEWTAVTDNDTTATNLQVAINALPGITASVSGSIITVTGATIDGVESNSAVTDLAIGFQVKTANAAAAAGTETFDYVIHR